MDYNAIRSVVRSLLAGNDTLCFATPQYRDAYCARHCGGKRDHCEGLAAGWGWAAAAAAEVRRVP